MHNKNNINQKYNNKNYNAEEDEKNNELDND